MLLDTPSLGKLMESKLRIKQYISRHFNTWVEFANDQMGLGLSEEELRFVAGFHSTDRFLVSAFKDELFCAEDAQAVFSVGRGSHLQDKPSKNAHRLGHGQKPVDGLSNGGEEASGDLHIFIHYYKVKRRLFHITALRAAAGAHQLPPGPGDSGTSPAVPSNYESCIDQRDTAQKQTLVRMTAYHSIGLTRFLLVLPRSC